MPKQNTVLAGYTAALFCGLLFGLCSSKDYCEIECQDDFYGRFLKHFMCLYPKDGPSVVCLAHAYEPRPLSDADKDYLLDDHNRRRSHVALGNEPRGIPGPQHSAANMRQLEWDAELERFAERWAMQCDYESSLATCLDTDTYSVGPNVHLMCHPDGFRNDIQMQLKDWFDEVSLVVPSTVDQYVERTAHASSHYTQIVWANTYRLGCARTTYHHDDTPCEYLVCMYGPAGNVNHEAVYESGDPCGRCTNNCSERYAGLCAPAPEVETTRSTGTRNADGIVVGGNRTRVGRKPRYFRHRSQERRNSAVLSFVFSCIIVIVLLR